LPVALIFDSEAKWYPSTLSAILCQQGFLFDSLGQNDRAKICFEAVIRMLPMRSKGECGNHERFLKIILRNRISASRSSSALGSVPECFEHIPGLHHAFLEHSLSCGADAARAQYMNISGWLAFCSKYRFHAFFPSLNRSKCISCFMESAKKSYGNTLLLSFRDFCSCLFLLKDAGTLSDSKKLHAHTSENVSIAAVVNLLEEIGFFVLQKQSSQRKQQKTFLLSEECGFLTTNVELPVLKSIVENESETWSLNCNDITVKGVKTECNPDEVRKQSVLIEFRLPFDFVLPFEDDSLSNDVMRALALLASQVSFVSYSCECLKLNQPALVQQGCYSGLQLMAICSSAHPLISRRMVQLIAVATIQEALCSLDATKAKVFFNKYRNEIKKLLIDLKNERQVSDAMSKTKLCDYSKNERFTCKSIDSKEKVSSRCMPLEPTAKRINENKCTVSLPKSTKEAHWSSFQSIPELPLEIIRFV
jgi:hypothetical protein